MKINDKEFLNPQQQLYQNTKDIEDLKEKNKNEVYAVKPYSEWPGDITLEIIEDPREFTYVPRAITNVPADAKYGYLLMNVENSFEPADSAALLFKIKSVNNTTVYIEFYANVASHVPGPQGEQGIQGPQGLQGEQGEQGIAGIGIYVVAANLTPLSGFYTNVNTSDIDTNRTIQVKDLLIGTNDILGQITAISGDTCQVLTITNLKGDIGPQGPQGQATIGIQTVAELPASGTEGVIYLVPAEDPETGNAYDEYIYTNSSWEKFGYLNIDLNNYALKSELPVIDEDLIPKAFNTYVLGTNSYSYKEVVANKFKTPNDYFNITSANVSGHGVANLRTTDGNGTNEGLLQISNLAVSINKNLVPTTSGVNLGNTSSQFNNLNLAGKILTDDNLTYGLLLPDTTSFTADKTLATTDQIPTLPTYSISNLVTDQSDVLGIQVTDGNVTANINNTTANPTLAGTEADLTSIDIGGTKYSVPNPTVSNRTITLIQNGASASFTLNQDSDKQITLPNIPTGTAASCDTGTSAGNVPVLDVNGKLSTSVLPAIAVTDTFVVSSEAAMLALTAQVGDIAVRTDLNKSFILQTDGASTLSHWQELLTPTDSVTSVNGQTGAVTITQADLNIVYSATQPSNPVNGTIWIKPTN